MTTESTSPSPSAPRVSRRQAIDLYTTNTTGNPGLARGFLAACTVIALSGLVGCGGGSDAAIGVQTAPPTAPTSTVETTTAPTAEATIEATTTASVDAPPDGTASQIQPGPATGDDPYLQFSECVRANGYPDFEDFTADAFQGATDAQDGARIFNEEMLRRGVDLADQSSGPAMEACQAYLNAAAAAAPQPSGADEQAQQELILTFAKCMRTQGVGDWPDPDFAANPPTGYSLDTIQSFDFQDPNLISAGKQCDPDGEVLAIFGR